MRQTEKIKTVLLWDTGRRGGWEITLVEEGAQGSVFTSASALCFYNLNQML